MSVGDVTSSARGSGARFNDGKPALELVPVRLLYEWSIAHRDTPGKAQASAMLLELARLQERCDHEPIESLRGALALLTPDDWRDCARVFSFGAKKYAAWNWAKGMAWSVPLACAVRHLLAILEGESLDQDSGLPHVGHAACNLVMLATYCRTYTEGDDRAPVGMLRAITRGGEQAQAPVRNDGAIEWRKPPYSGPGTVDICVLCRDGSVVRDLASQFDWGLIGSPSDIIGWRPA
jgi:hypothetical protein